jgi:hypothetical protein
MTTLTKEIKMDKIDEFFDLAGKHIKTLEKTMGIELDRTQLNDLGHTIVDIINEGYELARRDSNSVSQLLGSELYRKGKICEIDGISFFHNSSTYVTVVENGSDKYDFNLRNLPNFKSLEEFHSTLLSLSHDEDVQRVMEHNSGLAEACHKLEELVEILYWRKVARSIIRYHKCSSRDSLARDALLKAGFSNEEIDRYVSPIDILE